MNSYSDLFSLERVVLMNGVFLAILCLVTAHFLRSLTTSLVAMRGPDPLTKTVPRAAEWILAAAFIVLGTVPYGIKFQTINKTPKTLIKGNLVEVDRIGTQTLLRIETEDSRIIKVIRPVWCAWPTTSGPVEVEKFSLYGKEFINSVSERPPDNEV